MRAERRDFLKAGLGALLAAGQWPGALRAADADAGAFHFVAVNDLHSLDEKCGPWLERVVAQIKAHKEGIDFVLISGDQADGGKAAQLARVRDTFKKLEAPYYVTCGNHDYATQTDRKAYDDIFPGRLNFRFDHKGWQFLGFDTSDGVKYQKTTIPEATLKYLDAEAPKLDRDRPTVVFTHFPLGEGVSMRPLNADDLLKRLAGVNLRAVFSGHFHGFTERKAGGAALSTNKCCAFARGNHDGTKEKGYFLCRAKDGRVERIFVEVKPG
jgi:predicted MPP superfamily phosphohydrolase